MPRRRNPKKTAPEAGPKGGAMADQPEEKKSNETGNPDRLALPAEWSKHEVWAWGKICAGEPADFNEGLDCKYCPLPWVAEAWEGKEGERRKLSSRFLETILLCEPWRSAVPHTGVIVRGAWFLEPIDLSYAKIDVALVLDFCRFDGAADFLGFKTPFIFSIQGSNISNRLALDGAEIGGDLFMAGGRFGEVRLLGANIKGQLIMDDARLGPTFMHDAKIGEALSMEKAEFTGKLTLDGAVIGGDLFMAGGRFGEVRLLGADIKGQLIMDDASFGPTALHYAKIGQALSMESAEFTGELALDGAKIGGSLFMAGGKFGEVRLLGADIKGQLAMKGAEFSGELTLQRTVVGDALLMRGEKTVFKKPVYVFFSEVGTVLDISGAKFHSLLDLTGSKVDALLCGSKDEPLELKLDRFTYNHLGGLGWAGQKGERMTDWPAAWFVDWLGRQKEFSPQPYEQCAKVLRESGQPGKANEVLYACKEEERERAKGWRRVGLEILKWTIGYGYYYRRLLNWGIPLLYLGAVAASSTDQKWAHSMWRCFGYSLDMLLPVIRLAEDHYQTVLSGWQRYYFFAHQIAGYALATVALVGLTGLTERKR
jgi:hypothetical protein